jgi:hypothetical protein
MIMDVESGFNNFPSLTSRTFLGSKNLLKGVLLQEHAVLQAELKAALNKDYYIESSVRALVNLSEQLQTYGINLRLRGGVNKV